ncbi:MAG: hypothetical protein AAF532_03580 [Planctomycetota bacterium]
MESETTAIVIAELPDALGVTLAVSLEGLTGSRAKVAFAGDAGEETVTLGAVVSEWNETGSIDVADPRQRAALEKLAATEHEKAPLTAEQLAEILALAPADGAQADDNDPEPPADKRSDDDPPERDTASAGATPSDEGGTDAADGDAAGPAAGHEPSPAGSGRLAAATMTLRREAGG